jgi:hypothetical protein
LHFALCILHGLASLCHAQTASSTDADQDNVIIVLDASGSMRTQMKSVNKSRMEVAKSALQTVLADVPATTNVGLLVFSSRNLKNDWVYPLKPIDRAELVQAIQKPQPGGGTPLGAYLKKGTDALLKQRRAQHGFGTYRLLVVTDGKASDQDLVEAYLPDVLSRGITVDVIGVDMAPDLSLATQVHSYRTADNPEKLVEAVKNVFAEVGSGDDGSARSEADFDIIAPLPDQMATAMIAALANVSDHPIGEAPPEPAAPGLGSAPAASPEQYDPFKPGLPPRPAGGSSSFFSKVLAFLGNLCFFGFILLVVFAIILIQIGKSAQRRGRR